MANHNISLYNVFLGGDCPGLFRCHDSDICLALSDVCDGISHCPHSDDEKLCDAPCPPSCVCDGFSLECFNVTSCESGNVTEECGSKTEANIIRQIGMKVRKIIFSGANFSIAVPVLKNFLLAELNMASSSIQNLNPYNFQYLNNLYHLDLSANSIEAITAYTFFGLGNLETLILNGNPMLSILDPLAFKGIPKIPTLSIQDTKIREIKQDTFVGLSQLVTLNLSDNHIYEVEDGAFNSLSSLQTLDVRYNTITEFSDGIFQGLTGLKELYTDAYVFCCLKPDTVEDDKCLPFQDEFSSCSDLMRQDVLRAFVWIIGISSLIGNAGVFMYKMIYDKKSRTKGHGVLITNLSISDFCMGIYMLILAAADLKFKGRYIWNDIAWRNGPVCKLAGVLATVSSEASVLFLFLITLDRFLSIKYPFGQVQFHAKAAKLACLLVWILCTIIAVIPLLPIAYFNGKFYSRSAVCLALPLTRDKPPGWEYATALFICLNFVLFVCIAIGQLMIYREVSSTDKMIKSQRRTQDAVIARGLFLVVFSDFMCWFPLGVMGRYICMFCPCYLFYQYQC